MEALLEKSKSLLLSGDLKGSYEILTAIVQKSRYKDDGLKEDLQNDTAKELSDQQLADVYNCRGHIRYLWVDFNEAVEDYSEAIKLDNSHGIAYYNRGQIHYRMGRYEKAEQDLLTALEIIPNFEDAKLNLMQVQKDIETGRKFNVKS